MTDYAMVLDWLYLERDMYEALNDKKMADECDYEINEIMKEHKNRFDNVEQ